MSSLFAQQISPLPFVVGWWILIMMFLAFVLAAIIQAVRGAIHRHKNHEDRLYTFCGGKVSFGRDDSHGEVPAIDPVSEKLRCQTPDSPTTPQ